tara:strand:- start:232 stop:516 length:285 start_codon:yes stop_codon:yes gene_type:complete
MDGNSLAQFIPLILIFVIFYFFLIRPQQKRVKEHKNMVSSLKRGDEVITSGGIIGKVERVMEDDRIEVLLNDNVKVQIIKSTITSLLQKETTKK